MGISTPIKENLPKQVFKKSLRERKHKKKRLKKPHEKKKTVLDSGFNATSAKKNSDPSHNKRSKHVS